MEADIPLNALAGLRLCVKDNIAVKGQLYSAGHPLFAARVADFTAPSVLRLLRGGAVFTGMTETDSGGFGMTTPRVANPIWTGRTVGGSSGGAAAAVASCLADIGLGTDTGGSVRVPAACTGLWGFKPSYGCVPMLGIESLAPSFDHVGLLARDLKALRQAAVVLLDEGDWDEKSFSERPLRIAIEKRMPNFAAPEFVELFEQVKDDLTDEGHELVVCDLPDRESLAQSFGTLVLAEAVEHYGNLNEQQRQQLGPAAIKALTFVPTPSAIKSAQKVADAARALYDQCLSEFDVLLTPSIFIPPPEQGKTSIEIKGRKHSILSIFLAGTCFANLLGAAALCFPLPRFRSFSLHLTAARGRDRELFAAANCISNAQSLM